MGSELSEEIV